MRRLLLFVLCLACSNSTPSADPPADTIEADLEAIRGTYALTSISVVTVEGNTVQTYAVGDAAPGVSADARTLYGLASCSKPIVGLAAAKLFERQPDLTLDTDIADVLDWSVAHPDHPDAAITFRHLLTHAGGLEGDSSADYETYPKPDPDAPLGAWLEALLADEAYWLETAPGAAEAYSNLGVALLAHAIEAAAGQDFRAFTRQHIFDPLGLGDTRWFFGDLSASQQARHAIPYDADGEPYAIYGFNDYPSGMLRSTAADLGRLLIALSSGGSAILLPDSMRAFETTPMLIETYPDADARRFEHSGGEAGVTTYLTWRSDGVGYAYLINTDVDDDRLDALHAALDALLTRRW